jgi:hypothetical protein
MIRPPMTVLPDSAVVPKRNRILPAPNHFTHEIVAMQPYYYALPGKNSPPDGEFSAGTKVVLLARGRGPYCHVADERGLYVATAFGGLRKL